MLLRGPFSLGGASPNGPCCALKDGLPDPENRGLRVDKKFGLRVERILTPELLAESRERERSVFILLTPSPPLKWLARPWGK